jgi:N-glycosylase/DNA lyase
MEDLLRELDTLKNTAEVCDLIARREVEFQQMGQQADDMLFQEMCFCILTANFNGERTIKIQDAIGDGFCTLQQDDLVAELRAQGYRFPNVRSKFICEARRHRPSLGETLASFSSEFELREWLAKNVNGLGYKEASHFLRNIGYTNSAIIDFHIVDLLERYGLVERPKTMTKRKYLEIEEILREIGRCTGLNLSELDLYLWYMETGKILK